MIKPAQTRFIKLNTAGTEQAPTSKRLTQVHDLSTGLIWSAKSIKVSNWQDAMDKAAALKLGGHTWRAPTRAELVTLIDDTRRSPAIDTAYFPDTKNDWYWSSSPLVGDVGFAWYVYFGGGLVGNGRRDLDGFVRPVRVASPRQSLAVGKPTRKAARGKA